MKQELILELMEQAGELAYEEHKTNCLKDGLDPERTVWSVTGSTFEKFAELIVRECALQCIHNEDMDRIEKHFGVEE